LMDITIIHGTGGNPNGNWFPWLADQLTERGHTVRRPEFPTPENQSLDSWMKNFQNAVPALGDKSVLIGHSIGVAFIANVLNKLPAPIAGTFLASGFIGAIGNADYDPLNASFFKAQFDWKKIRQNAGALHIYAGDNDPYVPFEKSLELARLLQSQLTVIPNGGHLNYESNFSRFEKLLSDIDDLNKKLQ
jgi:predicted alpha/beta hydrolase family esterase